MSTIALGTEGLSARLKAAMSKEKKAGEDEVIMQANELIFDAQETEVFP